MSDTNTSSQTFMSFTGVSFINDCLLQLMLPDNHPLPHYADVIDIFKKLLRCYPDFIVTGFTPQLLRRPNILQDEL